MSAPRTEATAPAQDLRHAPVSEADVARLQAALAERADAEGLLEIAYCTVSTPVGALLLAATSRGLVRVAFDTEGFDEVLGVLARRVSPRILYAPGRLERAATELNEYFLGSRHTFTVPLDFALSSGFRQQVQQFLPQISYGVTRTYQQVAREIGHPRAVRAVGSACATNPLPVVIPCHRVVRTDGGLGGYLGGLDVKRALLAAEQAA